MNCTFFIYVEYIVFDILSVNYIVFDILSVNYIVFDILFVNYIVFYHMLSVSHVVLCIKALLTYVKALLCICSSFLYCNRG